MEFQLDYNAIEVSYDNLSSDQQNRFFPGGDDQFERVIGSLAYILGCHIDYDKLVQLYLTIASRIMLMNFANDRIAVTVKMRFSDIVPEAKMDTVIICVRNLLDNYSYLYSSHSEEYKQYEQEFDEEYAERFSENAELETDATAYSGFGVDPDNPIYAHMPNGSYEYLNKLYTHDLVPVLWVRDGTVNSEFSEDPIDKYDLSLPDGEYFVTVYINMYSKYASEYCPRELDSFDLEELPDNSVDEDEDDNSGTIIEENRTQESFDERDDEYLAFLRQYAIGARPGTSVKVLSKEGLDEALSALSKSKSGYTDPPPESAMCYSIAESDYRDVSFKCNRCGKTGTLSVEYWSDKENSLNIISDYKALAARFREAGYEAKVSCYCKDCVAKDDEKIAPIVFSFKAAGMSEAVDSYPNERSYWPQDYEMALAFLKGKHTISEISDDSNTRLNGDVYISKIKKVIGPEPGQNLTSAASFRRWRSSRNF